MKKIISLHIVLITIILATMFTGCRVGLDEKYKPSYSATEKWVCQEVDMYFYTKTDEYDFSVGAITIDDKSIDIVIGFVVNGPIMSVYLFNGTEENGDPIKKQDNILFDSYCRFKKGKFIAKIWDEYEGVLGEGIDKLTFIREDVDE